MSQKGSVSITMTDIPALVVFLSIGTPADDGSCKQIGQGLYTPPQSTPQLTATLDAGNYCVRIVDVGHIAPSGLSFTLTVAIQ